MKRLKGIRVSHVHLDPKASKDCDKCYLLKVIEAQRRAMTARHASTEAWFGEEVGNVSWKEAERLQGIATWADTALEKLMKEEI